MNLDKLFNPKKIAIIGANESEGFGGAVCKNMMKNLPPDREVFFVNHKRDMLFEKKCYKSILDIEENLDMVVIATNKNTCIEILKECPKKNVKAAVLYASGFSETGKAENIELEEEILKVAKENDIAILGPNCAGFVNFIDGINAFAFLSEDRDRKGNIGIISQSGMVSLSLIDNQYTKFSYNISLGNANGIEIYDLINFLIEDINTKVIGLYVDGIKNIDKFEESLSKAYSCNKKVVILKSGSNDITREITKNHTGSVEKFSDEFFNNMLKKYKVYRCKDLEEFIYTLVIISSYKNLPKGKNIASINLSGGEAAIVGEASGEFDFKFPKFSYELEEYLKNRLPDYAHISNPLDMTVTLSYDSEKFADALYNILKEKNIDMVLIGYTLLRHIDDPCIYYMRDAIKIVRERMKDNRKPIFIMCFMSNTREQKIIEELLEYEVIVLPTPFYAFKILSNLTNNFMVEN